MSIVGDRCSWRRVFITTEPANQPAFALGPTNVRPFCGPATIPAGRSDQASNYETVDTGTRAPRCASADHPSYGRCRASGSGVIRARPPAQPRPPGVTGRRHRGQGWSRQWRGRAVRPNGLVLPKDRRGWGTSVARRLAPRPIAWAPGDAEKGRTTWCGAAPTPPASGFQPSSSRLSAENHGATASSANTAIAITQPTSEPPQSDDLRYESCWYPQLHCGPVYREVQSMSCEWFFSVTK